MGERRSRTRWFLAGFTTALVIALLAAGLVILAQKVTAHWYDAQMSPTVARLESGSLTLGDEWPHGAPIWQGGNVILNGGERWTVFRYQGTYRSLTLYLKDDRLFGAQLFDWSDYGTGTFDTETWYFCDADLMAEYVTLATREPESP